MKIRQLGQKFKKVQVLVLLFILISTVSITFLSTQYHSAEPIESKEMVNEKQEAFEVMGPKTVEVVLKRIYLDGEISEERLFETIWSMEDFWAYYEGWDLIDQNEQQVLFQQKVDDISPLLKFNGYFGISDDGFLKIYEGKPGGEKVIQSFFQINTKKLKSQQQTELVEGIPVMSRENYQEVISALKKYAISEM
ncbi:intercompartmental signaling factor BofC [Bacillus sp. FJAT-45350]|uniref:intercompartmental signaling factor BofC n=1 Tax=Bacillus sp. FJAT-45350 TaxID=2011014 RepID=UPI000BB7C563|nr:intercompartmental signaling factor BofC [Bacillus sp. FJAT-45350]